MPTRSSMLMPSANTASSTASENGLSDRSNQVFWLCFFSRQESRILRLLSLLCGTCGVRVAIKGAGLPAHHA